MSDSEEDEVPREKVKKTLLSVAGRQPSKQTLNYKGVKSYLHQFYDFATDTSTPSATDRQLYIKSRKIRIRSLWWRITLYSGAFLMLLGAVAFLLSWTIPARPILISEEPELAVVDREAAVFNRQLELLRLAGLATFCIGGVSASLALLVASCCWKCCHHLQLHYDDIEPESVVRKLVEEDEDQAPLSPVESRVPGFGSVHPVQPQLPPGGGGVPYPIPVIRASPASDQE
ncbi:neurensin-2-like [Paramacrobiotus metropolitanus]|uniref:neurensin-2-like n=1 Tax=Paramacrobiotus metropolitanus TaxID=2943436 RepID=UPI002445A530|nr:neurensin-2-like [Paramacrobiotus metropolitanus]